MTAKLAIGWTRTGQVANVRASELTTVLTSEGPLVIPGHDHIDHIAVWYADSLGDLEDIKLIGSVISSLNTFGEPHALIKDGVPGKVILTIFQRVGDLVSGLKYQLDFTGE